LQRHPSHGPTLGRPLRYSFMFWKYFIKDEMLKLFNLSLFILVMNIYALSSNNLESGSNN
jgi:hypothetical protein